MATNSTDLVERLNGDNGNVKPGKTLAQGIEDQRDEIARVLPKGMDPDQFTRIVLTTCRRDDKIMSCTPATVLGSMMLCAELGLYPGAHGHVYLIPRHNSVKRKGEWFKEWQCTVVVSYQGWVELIRRSGAVARIEARAVFPGDEFDYQFGTEQFLRHKPTSEPHGLLGTTVEWEGEKGNRRQVTKPIDEDAVTPTHVYAFARLANGEDQFVVLSWEDAMQYKAFGNGSVWNAHPVPMAMKTAILRLRTWLPRSTEVENAYVHDDTSPTIPTVGRILDSPRPEDPPAVDVPEVDDRQAEAIEATSKTAVEQIEDMRPGDDPRAQLIALYAAGDQATKIDDIMSTLESGTTRIADLTDGEIGYVWQELDADRPSE